MKNWLSVLITQNLWSHILIQDHHSKYEKDIPCDTFVFDRYQDKFVDNVKTFAPVIRAMIPVVGDVNVVASRFNLINQSASKITPFHRDFLNEHWVGSIT